MANINDTYTGGGNVIGAASSTDGAVALYDGTGGKTLKDSKVVITIPASASTLTIASGKTFTCSNTLTIAGTDASTLDARKIDINAQTGTTYTNVLTDAGKLITCSNASAIAFTLATNASVAHPVGQAFAVQMIGAGVVTITGDTGVTINGVSAGASAMTQYQTIYLVKTATNTWLATGGTFA